MFGAGSLQRGQEWKIIVSEETRLVPNGTIIPEVLERKAPRDFPKYEELDDAGKYLTRMLVGMVKQNIRAEDDRGLFSGFIGHHADVMRLLADMGIMEINDIGGRTVYGKFVPPADDPWFG